MQDVTKLKQYVPLQVVAGLYVEGLRQEGAEFVACCPFHDEKTPSFKIYTDDEDKQWFKCFGCAAHGDTVTFIEKIENCSTAQAIQKFAEIAEKMMGAKLNSAEWDKKAAPVMASFKSIKGVAKRSMGLAMYELEFERALAQSAPAQYWLVTERGITMATAKKLHIGFAQSIKAKLEPKEEPYRDGGWIVFPKIIGDKVVAVKFRSMKAKVFSQISGMEMPSALFNVNTISPFDPIFVTEGEFDAAILEQHGYHAVSVPAAGVKLPPEMKKLLKNSECIYLAGDNDGKVGTLYMKQLLNELGEATYLLKWDGAKDANEFFLKHKEDFQARVNRAIITARATPAEEFTSLTERLLSVGDVDAGNDPHRAHFPWPAVDAMNYTPAGGIIVVYSTYSGTGKSVFTTEWMLHEARRGEVVVVYSPELRDAQYLALVASQTLGPKLPNGLPRGEKITREQFAQVAELLDKPTDNSGNFQYYVGHRLPVSEPGAVIDFIEHVVQVTGATRFVIDTIHRVVGKSGRESQTEAEGRVVKELERIAIKYLCTFVLIGQSNKEAEGLKELNRDELGVLRGCRELTDVSYAQYLLHRKRIKQQGSDANDILESKMDVHLQKDRGRGPGKPMVSLVYLKNCSTFREHTSRDEDEFPTMRQRTGDDEDASNY